MPGLSTGQRCPRCGYKLPQDKHFTNQIREEFPNAFQPWKMAEDVMLHDLTQEGHSLIEISRKLGRQPTAIKRRMDLLQLTIQKSAPAPALQDTTKVWQDQEAKELERVTAQRTTPGHLATEDAPSRSGRTRKTAGALAPQTA